MNLTRKILFAGLIGLASFALPSCKAKKVVAKPMTPIAKAAPVEEKKAEPVQEKKEEKAAPVEKPNFDFATIQFEFNSFVLKTASIPLLDKAAAEMKKSPGTKFIVNGHSSAEGSDAHNMSLSVDRANAVKSYFVNAGFSADNFKVVGHGDKEPVSSNDTEAGRILNRRANIEPVE